MTDDQAPLDLDAIRGRLRLCEQVLGEIGLGWTAEGGDDLMREIMWADETDQLGVVAQIFDVARDVHPLMWANDKLTDERDRARDLAAALEAELETARASETRWLTEVALRATGAWRHGMDDEYEIALLDVLGWWLESRQAPAAAQTIPRIRGWAGQVTGAHERGERLDERTLLALWEHAHE